GYAGAGRLSSSGMTTEPAVSPWISVEGMRNRRSPLKPTTSASTARSSPWTIRQVLPTGSFSPVASMTSPATRVRRPAAAMGAAVRTRAVQRSRNLARRAARSCIVTAPGRILAQGRERAFPAGGQGGVDVGLVRDDAAAAGLDASVFEDLPLS